MRINTKIYFEGDFVYDKPADYNHRISFRLTLYV